MQYLNTNFKFNFIHWLGLKWEHSWNNSCYQVVFLDFLIEYFSLTFIFLIFAWLALYRFSNQWNPFFLFLLIFACQSFAGFLNSENVLFFIWPAFLSFIVSGLLFLYFYFLLFSFFPKDSISWDDLNWWAL